MKRLPGLRAAWSRFPNVERHEFIRSSHPREIHAVAFFSACFSGAGCRRGLSLLWFYTEPEPFSSHPIESTRLQFRETPSFLPRKDRFDGNEVDHASGRMPQIRRVDSQQPPWARHGRQPNAQSVRVSPHRLCFTARRRTRPGPLDFGRRQFFPAVGLRAGRQPTRKHAIEPHHWQRRSGVHR